MQKRVELEKRMKLKIPNNNNKLNAYLIGKQPLFTFFEQLKILMQLV